MSKKIVANVFNYARAEGASGLVITTAADRVALHYHFPDAAGRELSLPKKLAPALLSGLRQILGLAEGELLARKYYKVSDPQLHLDFYLSVLPDEGGEKIIIDIVRHAASPWRLQQLGLERRDQQVLKDALRQASGLILIAAQDGGGKSATLRALLSHINTADKSICLLGKAAQGPDGITCLPPSPQNWRKVLQNNYDVIAAEDCDGAALAEALQAAATGRLVLATVTAPDALAALGMILEIALPLRLKLDALKMIVGQDLARLKTSRRSGRSRRDEIGLFEILKLSPRIKEFVLTAKDGDLTAPGFLTKVEKQAAKDGFRTLAADRRQKTRAGLL